ncbi:MAG: OmpA family protein [Treponema sp.]|nr:OmpA family protein [Treponema sp.]
MNRKITVYAFFFLCALAPVCAQHGTMTATSSIDWQNQQFISSVTLDTEKAGITLPSGRNAATELIRLKMPILIKDPLFSLYVDNSRQLGNLITDNTLTLKQITDVINSGKKTPAVFKDGTMMLVTANRINMHEISKLLVKQRNPYAPSEPMQSVSSRAYSGIIIDARGKLPVQGEYIESVVSPCFFPQIWNENMDIVYERDMVDFDTARKSGIVMYGATDDVNAYAARIGYDPLYIRAVKVYGRNRTDPVISIDDALRILTVPQNRTLLRNGKVVILLDEIEIAHSISVPQKGEAYYVAYNTLRRDLAEKDSTYDDFPNYSENDAKGGDDKNNGMPHVDVRDSPNGVAIFVENLKFIPDSAELLPEEHVHIARIANALKKIVANNEYTILVEGHTADVGKPVGQMNLSIERTRTIMNLLIAQGIPQGILSYRGYGGTIPAASNETEEGRKQNRRVIITVQPKTTTFIQRD